MSRPVSSAAIIGLHWGLVHLRGLREAGCEVVALAATDASQARSVADRLGVARGTCDIASLNSVDVVVIATPASTHAGLIAELPAPFLVCEKPLLGLDGQRCELPRTSGRMYVNYAFGFLASARCVDAAGHRLGPPEAIDLRVGVALEQEFDPARWFLEAASHPLSWLLLRFGRPRVLRREISADEVAVDLVAGEVPVRVRLVVGGESGIHHDIRMRWGRRELVLRGRYRPGREWEYDPVLLEGAPLNAGEWTSTDCWQDANAASVRAMIASFRGTPTSDSGRLFDAGTALWVEDTLLGPLVQA